MSNYRRAFLPGGTFFFTAVTFRRRYLFDKSECRKTLRQAIERTRQKHPFRIDAWVLLPEHMHCIWTLPQGDADFSKRWSLIKSRFSKQTKTALHKPEWMNPSKQKHRESTVWQRRFWEHLIRDEEDYRTHVDYIHYNPVKHGLVGRVKDWPYSTFHRYVAAGLYPANWGGGAVADLDHDIGE
ncbi:MAG: transposase [Candidatus Electrothrix communis]|nr:MAG: transposase [Candidatus Electrothrix communis]